MVRIKGLLLLSVSLILISGCYHLYGLVDSVFVPPDAIYYSVEFEKNGKRYEYIEHDSRWPRSSSIFAVVRYDPPLISVAEGRLRVYFLFNEEYSLINKAQFYSDTTFFVSGKKYSSSGSHIYFFDDQKTIDIEYWLEKGKDDISFSVCFECTTKEGNDPLNYYKNGRINIYNRCPIDNPQFYDFLRTE